MKIHILGAGAGGGFPQWNCACRNCRGVRDGSVKATARTQSSIAVSPDGTDWILVNASPDILQQLRAFPAAWPGSELRGSGLKSIVLVDGQIDHTTGLYMLREHNRRWPVWATGPVYEDLTRGNPILGLLEHYCGVDWQTLPFDSRPFAPQGSGRLAWHALPLSSAAPPYSPHRNAPTAGDNIGLTVIDPDSGGRLFYAPGLAEISPAVRAEMEAADCVLVDGTFWTDDEMIRLGFSTKLGSEIGHLAQSGPDGMIEQLNRLPRRNRRILIHINNTNPILDEASPERALLDAAGIEVAYDGMEITL